MKIGVVRGGLLYKWDVIPFEKMRGVAVSLISTYANVVSTKSIKLPIIKLHNFGELYLWIGYPAIVLDYFINMSQWLFGLKSALKSFDIVEVSDITFPFSYQAVKNHPLVVCNIYENIPFFREFGITKKRKEFIRKNASHFIAVTQRAKDALILEGVNENKIVVIPSGIDTDIFKPGKARKEIMDKYKIKNDDINILFSGRLVYDKGVIDLIYAFYILRKKHKNVNLLILGRGPLKKLILQKVKQLNIFNNVKFLGFLDYLDTTEYYHIAQIFCVPSTITKYWQEQFGFVFAEALSSGLPIVTTDTGSIRDVVGDVGIYVPPGNPFKLADALIKLVEDKVLRKDISLKARAKAEKTYDSRIIASKRLEFYKKILADRKW